MEIISQNSKIISKKKKKRKKVCYQKSYDFFFLFYSVYFSLYVSCTVRKISNCLMYCTFKYYFSDVGNGNGIGITVLWYNSINSDRLFTI